MNKRSKDKKTGGEFEFCPTARWPVARYLEQSSLPARCFRPGARWLEPHAGKGAIIAAVNSIIPGIVWTACEIRSEARDDLEKLVGRENVHIGDFHSISKRFINEGITFDVVITNPAFSLTSMVRDDALLIAAFLAMLVPTSFLGSAERQPKHSVFMPMTQKILPDRPSFTESGETDSRDYCWVEFTPQCGPVCMTTVLGLTPIEERKRDHAALFQFLLKDQQLGLFEDSPAPAVTETNRRPETTHDMSKPAIGMTYNQAQNINFGECPNNGPSCNCNACVMCESLTCTCGCKMIDHHSDGEGCTTCQTCPSFILAAWKNGPVIGSCKGPWGTHRKHGEVCNDCAFPMIADATQAGWSDKPVMSPITTPPEYPHERCIIPPHEEPPAPSADVPPQAHAEAPKRKRRTKAAKPQDAPTVAAQPPVEEPAPPSPAKEEPPPEPVKTHDEPKQETPVATGLMGTLAKQFPEAFAPEIIDGCDVEKTAADVMLDVAFSPVLPSKDARYPAQVSELYGGKYRVYYHREEPAPFAHMTGQNERDVSANELKVMRARYLLRRGELSKLLHAMEPYQREHWQKIYNISFVPTPGSKLHDLVTGATANPITIPLKPGENPLKAMGALLVEAGANPDEIRIIGTDDEDQIRSVSYAALPTSIAITQDDLDAKAATVERAQKAVQDDDTPENRKALRDAETELEAWQQVHAEQQASMPAWVWGEASSSLDRTGMARYTHIVRAADDPERTDIRALPEHLRDRQAAWRNRIKETPPATYKPLILALLADGLPRTFNQIGVELLDKTADNLLDLPPDKALWELVHEGRVEHTTNSPILFRRRNRKDRTKEEVAEDVRVTLAALSSALEEGETVTVEVLQDMLVEEHDEVRTWAECMVLWKQGDRSTPPPAKPTYFATWVDKPKPPFMVDANTAKDPCRPGAWGSPTSCITHEGQPLDENGLCFWGREPTPLEKAVRSAFMDHDQPPEGFSRIHDDGDTVIFMGPTIDLRDLTCDITPGCVVGKNHMGRCTTNKNETCTQCGIACADHSDSPNGGSCKDCKKGCVRKRFSVMTEVWIRDLARINSDLADARWSFAEARIEYEKKRSLENAETLDKIATRIRHLTTNQTLIAAQLEGPHARTR